MFTLYSANFIVLLLKKVSFFHDIDNIRATDIAGFTINRCRNVVHGQSIRSITELYA